MPTTDKNITVFREQIKNLERENIDLKKRITSLSEITDPDNKRTSSWIQAIEANQDGVWDWNLITNEVFFSKRWKEILGYQDEEFFNNYADWIKRYHPDDLEAMNMAIKNHQNGKTPYYENTHRIKCKDETYKWVLSRGKVVSWTDQGKPLRFIGTYTDITSKKQDEIKYLHLIKELKQALAKIKKLSGLLPICASCKKIRDDKGYWNQIESYLSKHSEAEFTHGICPECSKKIYSDYLKKKRKK